MKLSAQRDDILQPLQQVIGVVERRQTNPVMGNVLLVANDNTLTLTTTDSEIEMKAEVGLMIDKPGAITVPARKLYDICKSLPEDSFINMEDDEQRILVSSGRSRFNLTTLPAENFPDVDELQSPQKVTLPVEKLLKCIRSTAFSMAQQDVRFFLNGMLLEIDNRRVSCVATDGHRLAHCHVETDVELEEPIRAIVPRKSVSELQRLLNGMAQEETVTLLLSSRQLQVQAGSIWLTTKLIDGRFPDYERVIPIDCNKEIIIDKQSLQQSLSRASILSNEKYRGVRLSLQNDILEISSQNPEQEVALDELEIDYQGDAVDIGFNVTYLLDILNVLDSDNAIMRLKDSASSALILPDGTSKARYVVMPMKL